MSGEDARTLRTAAARLMELAARTTPGDWRVGGLLASRPEVLAHDVDGGTEHVAEARAGTAAWIAALSPAVAEPLAVWLAATAAAQEPAPAALSLARVLLGRLPERAVPAGTASVPPDSRPRTAPAAGVGARHER